MHFHLFVEDNAPNNYYFFTSEQPTLIEPVH